MKNVAAWLLAELPWALLVAFFTTAIQAELRNERIRSTAWRWAGCSSSTYRIPSPRSLIGGCEGRIAHLKLEVIQFARLTRVIYARDTALLVDPLLALLDEFFQSVLAGHKHEMRDAEGRLRAHLKAAQELASRESLERGTLSRCRSMSDSIIEWMCVVLRTVPRALDDLRTERTP
jgi:hypothetical protein